MIWNQESVDRYMAKVLSPDVKKRPYPLALCGGAFELDNNSPDLFTDALGVAWELAEYHDNRLLMDALRKKWPKAVMESLPEIKNEYGGVGQFA